jgi:hypothetical protein
MPGDEPVGKPARSALQRLRAFLAASDAPTDSSGRPDPAEVWGRRIGRLLGLVALLALIYGLFHQITFR